MALHTATLAHWLLTKGPSSRSLGELVRRYTGWLFEAGVPVDRVFLGPLLVHPQAAGIVVIYDRETDSLRESEISHEQFAMMEAQNSKTPMRHIIDEETPLRVRLGDGEDLGMEDLAALQMQGYVDFYALPVFIGRKLFAGCSLSTRSPAGFGEGDLAIAQAANRTFGPVAMLFVQRIEQASLLRVYLGADAGARVQRGQVRRGDGQRIRVALCIFDMKNFAVHSSQLPPEVILSLLDDMFSVLVHHVEAHGGEVLKFAGGGILAVFSDQVSPSSCADALSAAVSAHAAIKVLNDDRAERGEPVCEVSVGLHHGEVVYGNVGAPGRLDFTVIGAAVILAQGIQGLCDRLETGILMSEAFSIRAGSDAQSFGRYQVPGALTVEVFGMG